MNILCLLLFCAIFYPVSIEVDEEVYRDFPQLNLFSSALRKLVRRFFEERKGVNDNSRPVLAETKMVETAVEELRGGRERKEYDSGFGCFKLEEF
ncbi:hypothetical protein OIU77_004669 [Salix suchowensis]|uniref:Uncharacterized protein n=1 Tax=Salix suchowensis TaxID=1278906 RepID=A0ABQ9AWS5_9ROSI|nr:hypothetical protein OIU77_004669 [Salix suchowensis]